MIKGETTYANELWEHSELPKGWLLQYTHTCEISLDELEMINVHPLYGRITMAGYVRLLPESPPSIRGAITLFDSKGRRECYLHLLLFHRN